MIKIIDTYRKIEKLHFRILENPTKLIDYWEEYIKEYTGLKELCYEDASSYSIYRQVKPVLSDCLLDNYAKTKLLHDNFIEVVEDLNNRFYKVFEIKGDIVLYFYIGLCNGAGWVTFVNNYDTVLLGAEKIVELSWYDKDILRALIYHELCHAAHSKLRGQSIEISFEDTRSNSVWQLYTEGFAQRYQQALYGDEFYHQDKDGWLLWCENNHSEICKEYLYRLEKGISTADFYGDWNNYKGKSDVGYYLGCEFIKYLGKYYTFEEIYQFQINEINSNLLAYLKFW